MWKVLLHGIMLNNKCTYFGSGSLFQHQYLKNHLKYLSWPNDLIFIEAFIKREMQTMKRDISERI